MLSTGTFPLTDCTYKWENNNKQVCSACQSPPVLWTSRSVIESQPDDVLLTREHIPIGVF